MEYAVNLTPHKIAIVNGEEVIEISPSGTVARVKTVQKETGITVFGIPVVKTEYTEIEGLPSVCENCLIKHECTVSLEMRNGKTCGLQFPEKIFIVSSIVAQAVKSRKDVIAPDTSPESAVRDEEGRIIGIKRFQMF